MTKSGMMRLMLGSVVFSLALAARCWAGDAAPFLLEKVLDEQAQLTFKEVTLEEAFASLSKTLGVPIETDEAAIGQLPYGRLTRLSVQFAGITWREALKELLRPLALRFQTGRDRFYILGSEELMRQPQRLTMLELNALVKLQTTILTDREEKLLKQIRAVTGLNFGLMVGSLRLEEADKDKAERILTAVGQPATQVLDLYGQHKYGLTTTWYVRGEPSGKTDLVDIVFVMAADLYQMKLACHIDVQFSNRPVQEILLELSRRAGLETRFEPGCIAMLDDSIRQNCSLAISGGTVRTALDALAGMTGLKWSVDGKGILMAASDNLRTLAASRAEAQKKLNPAAIMLTVPIPGTTMNGMIVVREQELRDRGLWDAFQKMRQRQLQDFYNSLGKDAGAVSTPPGEKK
jgi:hypothetical protein